MPSTPMVEAVVALAYSVVYTLLLACPSYDINGPRASYKETAWQRACPAQENAVTLCNVLQLFQRWQTCTQSSASHVVASSVACKSLHPVMRFSVVQHECRVLPSQKDELRIVNSFVRMRACQQE